MKPKPSPPSQDTPTALTADQKALVDESGRLKARLALVHADILRDLAIDKTMRSWCKDDPGEMSRMFEGYVYVAVLGMAGEQTRIASMTRVFVTLGRKRFLDLCSMTLEKLKTAVSAEKFEDLTTKERTGSRSISVVAKPEA